MTDLLRRCCEAMEPALRYIEHVGANFTERGEPHPQQWIVDRLRVALAQAQGLPEFNEPSEPPHWVHVYSKDDLEAFYKHSLPRARAAARECGYALGVHGSMRRDLDLIAAPWIANHADKDTLARAVQHAVCGMEMTSYSWGGSGEKPCGRQAASFAVCWPELMKDETNLGCIDLSVMPDTMEREK